jgi:transcriptional regulator with XRE-family HTH domain
MGSKPKTVPLASKFPGNLKAARVEAGLSQEALAAKCALSTSYISMLERGSRMPPLDTLELISRKGLGRDPLLLLA